MLCVGKLALVQLKPTDTVTDSSHDIIFGSTFKSARLGGSAMERGVSSELPTIAALNGGCSGQWRVSQLVRLD